MSENYTNDLIESYRKHEIPLTYEVLDTAIMTSLAIGNVGAVVDLLNNANAFSINLSNGIIPKEAAITRNIDCINKAREIYPTSMQARLDNAMLLLNTTVSKEEYNTDGTKTGKDNESKILKTMKNEAENRVRGRIQERLGQWLNTQLNNIYAGKTHDKQKANIILDTTLIDGTIDQAIENDWPEENIIDILEQDATEVTNRDITRQLVKELLETMHPELTVEGKLKYLKESIFRTPQICNQDVAIQYPIENELKGFDDADAKIKIDIEGANLINEFVAKTKLTNQYSPQNRGYIPLPIFYAAITSPVYFLDKIKDFDEQTKNKILEQIYRGYKFYEKLKDATNLTQPLNNTMLDIGLTAFSTYGSTPNEMEFLQTAIAIAIPTVKSEIDEGDADRETGFYDLLREKETLRAKYLANGKQSALKVIPDKKGQIALELGNITLQDQDASKKEAEALEEQTKRISTLQQRLATLSQERPRTILGNIANLFGLSNARTAKQIEDETSRLQAEKAALEEQRKQIEEMKKIRTEESLTKKAKLNKNQEKLTQLTQLLSQQ